MLQITQNIGKTDDGIIQSERIRRIKVEKDSVELEFALQLWYKINWYLYTYVDSSILVDFLMILLSNSKRKAVTAEKYLADISQADDLSLEEIENNKQRNSELVLKDVWTVEQLFEYFKNKLNWPTIVTRTGFTIFPLGGDSQRSTFENSEKKQRLISEHYRECTFRPQISQKVREAEEKKLWMNKINQNLEVFNIDKHDIDHNLNGDKGSQNSSSKKQNSKNKRKTPIKSLNGNMLFKLWSFEKYFYTF